MQTTSMHTFEGIPRDRTKGRQLTQVGWRTPNAPNALRLLEVIVLRLLQLSSASIRFALSSVQSLSVLHITGPGRGAGLYQSR